MTASIREMGARVRNLFQAGEMRRRYDNGRVQVQTRNDMVVEGPESFPYGFAAKAKGGRAMVLCRDGDATGFEILPLLPGEGVTPPRLKDGDAALYTESGGRVVCRDGGTVELNGADAGGVVKAGELRDELGKMTARIDAIINALRDSPTAPQDGGATYKAAIAAALSAVTDVENFADIESGEVMHGTGG